MKTTLIAWISALRLLSAQDVFDQEKVKTAMEQISLSLKTSQVAIDLRESHDPTVKRDKFTQLIQEIAGPILSRQWTYPIGGDWPLIDWSKVNLMNDLIGAQKNIFSTTHAVALSDDEMARVCVVGDAIAGLGWEADSWYEDWIINLAKGQNTNLKRLVLLMTSKFGDEMGESESTGGLRSIDWNKWEQAFSQCDPLGKSILLVCMSDLAVRKDEFSRAAVVHMNVFNGSNDDLKAIAICVGGRKLGVEVVAKWQELADNHPDPKMKMLAQERLAKP